MILYRIGRIHPNLVIKAGMLLLTEGIGPAIPTYRKVIRTGRARTREEQTFQVMPGFMFVPLEDAPRAAAILATTGKRLNWLKNPASIDYATCSKEELRPVFEWGEQITQESMQKLKTRLYRFRVGQRIRIAEGPLQDMEAHVVRGSRGVADPEYQIQVELQPSGLPVTLPIKSVIPLN